MMSSEYPSTQKSVFADLNNPYNLLELDVEGPKKKPKMINASTQTTADTSTQTDSSDPGTTLVKVVATKAIEQDIQCDEMTAPASVKYPLNHINFEIIKVTDENLDELDEGTPEIAPYFDDAGEIFVEEEKNKQTFFGKALGAASNFLYWNAASISNYFRTVFYRTENELLRDMCVPHQEVRVSSSWFFSGEREVLYGLSHNSALQTRLFNVPKWLYYEGITSIFTSDRTAILKLYQVFPHVMEERIADLNKQISHRVEVLARKAITVLEDEDYDNINFLSELESDLREELDKYVKSTSEFIIHKTGEVKPGLKKVQVAMHNQIEKAFPEGGGYLDRQRYHIDALKVYSDRFFKMGDAIAQETIEAQERVINESTQYLTDSIEDRKGRIYIVTKELLELRADAQSHLDQYSRMLKEFKKVIHS